MYNIKIITSKINASELRNLLNHPFPDMIKFVVDVKREIMTLGGEMHADAEQILLEDGSQQENLWGGNIYPDENNRIEYTALINIRPSQNNKSMEIKDEGLKNGMLKILKKFLPI